MSSHSDIVELFTDIRSQLLQRGLGSFRTLEVAFGVNDHDNTRLFDFAEFVAILEKSGVFLKRQNLTKIYRFFDKDQNERVDYAHFLAALLGEWTLARRQVVDQIWSQLDMEQRGFINKAQLISATMPHRHPSVLAGIKSANAILKEIELALEGEGEGEHKEIITYNQFLNIFAKFSAPFLVEDQFISTMSALFAVQTDNSINGSQRATIIKRVQNVLREKIRQRSHATKSESESLRLTFKYFDTSNSGHLTLTEFRNSLVRFGIFLEEPLFQQLFNEFAVDYLGNGVLRVNYAQFILALYEDEAHPALVRTMPRTTLQNSKALSATNNFASTSNASASSSSSSSSSASTTSVLSGREYTETDSFVLSTSPAAPSGPLGNRSVLSATLAKHANGTTAASKLPTLIFLLGGPSSGRGSIARSLVEEYGMVHIDVDQIIAREQHNHGGLYGGIITTYIKEGRLLPVELILELIKKEVDTYATTLPQGGYFLLDGFPRSVTHYQAYRAAFGPILANGKVGAFATPLALYLQAPAELLIRRGLLHKRETEANLLLKLKIFEQDTVPLLVHLQKEAEHATTTTTTHAADTKTTLSNQTTLVVIDASKDLLNTYAQVKQVIQSI